MLNEGYTLYKSLAQCGIIGSKSFTHEHPEMRNPGKKDGLIVGIDKEGKVARIEYRNRLEIAKLWTTAKGNHHSFPAIKLQRPIWKVNSDDSLRDKLKKLKNDEQEKRNVLLNQSLPFNVTQNEKSWWQGLHERVQELHPFFETEDISFRVVYELMNRFRLASIYEDFMHWLVEKIKFSGNDIPYTVLENILIGNRKDKVKNEFRAEVPLILEVSDWDDKNNYLNRIASVNAEFRSFISDCLFKYYSGVKQTEENANIRSALSGNITSLVNDKFPDPILSYIGKTFIFSANKVIPCLTRYGKISTEIIPIGTEEANSIKDALTWITKPEKKLKTWTKVPSGQIETRNGKKAFKDDLLIVYIVNKPDSKVNKAHLLGGLSQDDFSDSDYEAISKVAIEALKGMNVIKASDLIRMFCLRKVDPGRTQISLQRIYTKDELLKADENWREAAKNIPKIALPFFRKEIERITAKQESISTIIKSFLEDDKQQRIDLTPSCPFPADLVRLTQKQWIRSGEDFSSVAGCSLGDIYDIFFTYENEKNYLIENLLYKTLQCTQALIIGMGNADHKKELKREQKKFSSEKRFTVLRTITAFAIYLHKLGIKKEYYMKDTFFYVGRFLSLIDTLHFEWCKCVRGGFPVKEEREWRKAIPPQLLGNAHFQIALDNPTSALSILSRRITNPYLSWAKKEYGDHMKSAKWAAREIGQLSDLMSEKDLPQTISDVERAQILLGYLSRPES